MKFFTPSGPPLIVTAGEAVPIQFTEQVEGVLAIINNNSVAGFLTLTNPTDTIKNNLVPVLPFEQRFVAFGHPQSSARATGSDLTVIPGFMSKVDRLPSIVDILSFDPLAFYLAQPQYMKQFPDATVEVAQHNDPIGFLRDLSTNGLHLTQSNPALKPLYRTDGIRSWIYCSGNVGGVGTNLTSGALNNTQPFEFITAFRIRSVVDADDRIIGGIICLFTVNSDQCGIFAGAVVSATSQLNIDQIAVARFNGASSRLKINNGAQNTGDAGASAHDKIVIGADDGVGSNPTAIDFLGHIEFNRAITDYEAKICYDFLGTL